MANGEQETNERSQRELEEQTSLLRELLAGQRRDQEQQRSRLDQIARRLEQTERIGTAVEGNVRAVGGIAQAGLIAGGTLLPAYGAARKGMLGEHAKRYAQTWAMGQTARAAAPWLMRAAGYAVPGLGIAAAGVGLLAAGRRFMGAGGGGGGGGRVQAELSQQTMLLRGILQEARSQNVTLQRAQVLSAARQDPFDRGPRFWQQQLGREGALISPMQAGVLAQTGQAQLRLQRSRMGLQRQMDLMTAPGRQIWAGLRSRLNETASGFMAGYAGDELGGRQGFGRFGYAIGRLNPMGPAINYLRNELYGGEIPETGPLGGQLQRQLFGLQAFGPARNQGPAPTLTAGTVGEYRQRAQLQAQQRNREETRRWQQQVLDVLRQLVERGKADADELYRTEVNYGVRNIEGIN